MKINLKTWSLDYLGQQESLCSVTQMIFGFGLSCLAKMMMGVRAHFCGWRVAVQLHPGEAKGTAFLVHMAAISAISMRTAGTPGWRIRGNPFIKISTHCIVSKAKRSP